jgi:ACS family hexuronate transporter-like MFS transporter
MGIGGFAGAMAGMLFQRVTGYILDASRSNYAVIFIIAGTTYLLALLIFHLLVPRMAPAKVQVIEAK